MTELLPHFKRDLNQIVLIPSDKGRFEIELDGELVYSKLETSEFPETAELIGRLEAKIRD